MWKIVPSSSPARSVSSYVTGKTNPIGSSRKQSNLHQSGSRLTFHFGADSKRVRAATTGPIKVTDDLSAVSGEAASVWATTSTKRASSSDAIHEISPK